MSGSIRIIGGDWRSRRIAVPASLGIRPTADRVRETLFNWLVPQLPGARCLDLYAGTGALAFEALSRGARQAVMVEKNRAVVKALESAREQLGATAEILHGDALQRLQTLPAGSFDIVFVDPPYAHPVTDLLAAVPRVLKAGGRIYLERDRSDAWPEAGPLVWLRNSTAGAVRFGLATLE